jgi:hypothetical protein
VRQDPALRKPAPTVERSEHPLPPPRTRRATRTMALLGALAAAEIVVTLALTVWSDDGVRVGDSTRVALIRMWQPRVGATDDGWGPFVAGLLKAERVHGLETETVYLFPRRASAALSRARGETSSGWRLG